MARKKRTGPTTQLRVNVSPETHQKLRILAALLDADLGTAVEHAAEICLALEQRHRGMHGLSPVPEWVDTLLRQTTTRDETHE